MKTEIMGIRLEQQSIGCYKGKVGGVPVAYTAGRKKYGSLSAYSVLQENRWVMYPTKEAAIEAIVSGQIGPTRMTSMYPRTGNKENKC